MTRPLSTVAGRMTRSYLKKQTKHQLVSWLVEAIEGDRPADLTPQLCHAPTCNHEIFIAPWVEKCPSCGEKIR